MHSHNAGIAFDYPSGAIVLTARREAGESRAGGGGGGGGEGWIPVHAVIMKGGARLPPAVDWRLL